jgi:hypothetical protein
VTKEAEAGEFLEGGALELRQERPVEVGEGLAHRQAALGDPSLAAALAPARGPQGVRAAA